MKKEPPTTMKFYKVGKVLGKGAFGQVTLGIHKLTGSLVAIKTINKGLMTNEASKSKILREVAILEQLKHENVIRYIKITYILI